MERKKAAQQQKKAINFVLFKVLAFNYLSKKKQKKVERFFVVVVIREILWVFLIHILNV